MYSNNNNNNNNNNNIALRKESGIIKKAAVKLQNCKTERKLKKASVQQ